MKNLKKNLYCNKRKKMLNKNKTVYYFLENNELHEVEVESTLSVDGRKEITFKKINTDEGGNDDVE